MPTLKLDTVKKEFTELPVTSFEEEKLEERYDLQEAMIKNLSMVFKEDLLLISAEFDKFAGANLRVDVLALDANGKLVIIENKRDDSGKHEHLQATDYATAFSTWTTEDIINIHQEYLDKNGIEKNARTEIAQFLEIDESEIEIITADDETRIFLVATNFQSHIINTVLAYNSRHNFHISCFKGTLMKNGSELIYDIDKIIPMKDAETYNIKMKQKEVEHETHTRALIKNPAVMNEVFNYFHDNNVKSVPLICFNKKHPDDPRFKQFNPAEIGKSDAHYEIERHKSDPNRLDVAFHIESGLDPAIKEKLSEVLLSKVDGVNIFKNHMGGISLGRISIDGKSRDQIVVEVEAALKKLYEIVEPERKKLMAV